MAKIEIRWPDNAPGRFYIDSRCINCQLCSELAPGNFACNEEQEYHYVARQPRNDEELERVRAAVDSCPCDCIGDDGPGAAVVTPATSDSPRAPESHQGRTLIKEAHEHSNT